MEVDCKRSSVYGLEKTIIDIAEEIPMPGQIRIMNGFLANPNVDKPQIIKKVNKGIAKLTDRFLILSYLHDFTNYEKLEKFLSPPYNALGDFRSDMVNELPRNHVYSVSGKLLSLLPDFKYYLQLISQSSESIRYGANETVDYFPQGVDSCLFECLLAIDKVGLLNRPDYIYGDVFRPFVEEVQKHIKYPVESEENRELFFHNGIYKKVLVRRRRDEKRGIDIKETDPYPYLDEYQRFSDKILRQMDGMAVVDEKNN